MYTVKEAAEQVGATEDTIRRWLRSGKITGVMPGGMKLGYRIPPEEIVRVMRGEPSTTTLAPKRRAATTQPSPSPALARALAEAERCRLRDDLEGAERWEQIAAGIAASTAQSVE